MKFKREIIIISLIIAMLFTVSSVCAVDSGIQATSAQNSTVEVVSAANDNDDLGMNDAGEILAETDDGSFDALNSKISGATAGSTVYLENDYEYSSSDSITNGIFIDKSLIIDGQGHKIDAKQKSRIFDCSPYAVVDVTLKNIIFLNGKSDYGGALYWYPDGGESNIINCTFIGNSASGSYGGGAVINEQEGISNIINCTFIDNHDTNCALYLSSTKVVNSVFLNNGKTTMEGQYIEADYNWFGNTIDNYDTAPSVTISSGVNNWYVLNMTTNGANNIATVDLNNLYDGSEIKPCDLYSLPSVTFDVEGTNATLNKDTVTLDSNGKASFGFTVTEDTGKLTASSNGVSISKDVVNMADEGTMAALNSKITDAISNGESEVKLYNDYIYSDSELVKNTINGGNSYNGIGIDNDFAIDGQGYTIDGNNKGGRIFYIFAQSKLVTLKNINFVNCTDDYAGVFYAAYCDLRVINCTFTNSTVTANPGGVAYVVNPVTVEIINSTFIKNKAPSGGAIFVFGAQTSNVLVNNSIFINNIASTNVGSAVYCNKYGSYTINNCILLNNTGYAVFNNNAQSTLNVDYNWWGNTIENSDDWEVVSSYDVNAYDNWVYLDVIIDDINSIATIKLNNLYTYGAGPSAYDYALPQITLNVQTTNADINENTITLDENGQATVNYEMTDKTGTLTVSYGNVELTKEIKLFVQDSFTSLKNQINETDDTTFTLNQNYNYNADFDESLTNGIEITKSITIDGNGYTIDAKGLSNIVYFNDDTNTKTIILKNIIFANAKSEMNGAAVYFKGKQIQIINCTFINNAATGQGDAVYVADATGNENKITESTFINNTGANSVVFVNLEDGSAGLNLSNSIFLGNDATFDVNGTSNVVVDYNWWGNTAEDYKTVSPKVDGATLNNWLVLNFTADIDTNVATVSLNNLYDGNALRVYESYALPSINVNIAGTNVTVQKSIVTLGSTGKATTAFKLLKPDAILTASYEDVETNAEIHYVFVDDGTFKALKDIIRFSSENDVIELTKDYVYSDTDTITPGIPITKTITINGNGHIIDAKGNCGIFLINSPNVVLNDITFKNGIFDTGGAIYCTQNADYLAVDNCTFINNTATNTDGGAIWSGSYYFGSIVNSTFINNTAVNEGAAFFTYSFYSDAVIDRCLFINNSAPNTVIYAYYKFNCHDSIFLNNTGNYIIGGEYSNWGNLRTNWYGNTFDNYDDRPVMNYGSFNWLYLNIKFYEDFAIVSLNNLYTQSTSSSSVYSNYNLPEITLNINSTTLNLETDKITLDSNGQAIVPYTKLSEDAKLTVSNDYVSLTKDVVVGDFYILQRLIDENDELELDRDYVYNGEDTFTEGIVISKNITIDGKGHTIDAKEMTRIFNVQATGVTFKNIVFANGKSNLDWQSNKPNDGGAIYYNLDNNELIEFNVINCTFVNNTAIKDITSKSFSGAAIYVKSNEGVYNIENSTFINNNAEGKGGAIYINTTDAEFNLYNSSFTGNKGYNDGALYIETDGTDITIDKCLFRENKAASTSYSNNGNAIIWKTTNDNGNSVVKNSVFLDNGNQKNNGQYTFLLISGIVNIDDNWWGTSAQNHPETFDYLFVGGGITPATWLFINADVSSDRLLYNETATIKYYLQAHDGTDVTSFDNSKIHYVDFDVSCDVDGLNKNHVSLNEEFTYTANNLGTANVEIYCNNIVYEIFIHGPYMIPRVDGSFTIYANQGLSKSKFIKTANDYYSKVTITCNDSSMINLNGNYDVTAKTNEGTVKLTFSYDGSYTSYPNAEDLEMVVKVSKVPLNITVTNLESNEITLNVTDTMDLNIAFEVDEIHKGYAPAWDTLGVKYDSNIISFDYEKGVRQDNGSYYPTGHILAKTGGTTNLTFYSTSNKFKWENYTIKITVNKIPTEITLGNEDSFKVDDTSNVNAVFLNNGTQSTTTLIFESSDEDVIKFTSNTGDFKAVGNGTAVLTVTFNGNSTHEASSKTITVTVSKYTTATSVTSDKTLNLKVDDDSQILATLTAEDGAELTISYESNDENVATVDSTGKITAVGEGTAIITAKYDGTYKYETSSDTVTVTVTKIATTIDLTSSGEVPLKVFEDSQIVAALDPSVAGSLTYASSNETVATVDSTGKITAHAGGKANITISFDGDYKYAAAEDVIVSVNVNKLPTTITVNPEISVDVDDTNTIVASANHGRALKYESLNSDVVTVDETTGVITGVIGGTGVINISFAEDGQYLAESTTVTVTVNKLTSSITVNPIEINVFDSQLIDPTVVSDGVVSYVSCDPVIVTVNATNGNITGVKGGKANVTIYVAESDRYLAKEVNVTVTVKKLPTEITVDPTITVDVDGTNTIDASANHGRALKYESLNPDIVTVDEDTGVITGVIGGTGEIKISFVEDDQYLEKIATVTVTVNKLNPTITVDPIEIDVFESKLINPTVVSDGTVTYESCDSSIVTVDENTGEITGVIGGVANVTIKVVETPRYLAKEANVTVVVNKVATIITVDPTIRLKMGDSKNIVATVVSGADIHYQTVYDIISVDEDTGLVTAIKGGVAEVTVSVDATDKYLANSTTVTVTVARLPDDDTPIELSVFSKADVSALYDFGSDPNNLKYNSSNITVFTVNETGMLEAKAGGEANLTISDEILGESVTIKVIVNKLDTIIAVNPTIDVKVYESKPLGAIVKSGRALIYESLNSDVVTVNETTGVITGVIGGTGVINISFAEDGQYKANSTLVTVTVNKLQSTIDINESEFSIFVDGTAAINATTNNQGGLLYASTFPFISLSNNMVTGVSQGVAEIKVIALENDKYLAKTEVVNVTVNRIPSTITVGGNNFTIDVDGSVDIGAVLDHEGDLTYKYNESIIAVENGLITGIIGGKTNITISYAGDNKYMPAEDVNVSVTVNKLPTTITVNSTISVDVDGTNVIEASADGRTLEFISYNETIVTVDDAGVITGVIGGVANVTVKFSENDRYLGDEVNVTVTVNKLTSTIAVNPIEIDVFDSQLINPEIVSDGVVSYVSCNTSIVTVNANGNVTGVKGGKANVTIKVAESDRYLPNEVNVTVTVNKLPTAITVNPAISIDYGKTKTIDASADNGGKLIYTSLNSDIVTVDENGLITAVKSGEATVNIKFEENETHTGNEVNVTVTVNRLPISIAITDANDVFVGGTSTIQLTINETDATGFVIVNVNGTEYPINISQTKSLSVVLDNVGDYDVYATYQGDDKYQTAESNPETVKAYPKLENSLEVNVTQNIITGQKVEINATSSSGIIDVYVDGVKQTVIDGKAAIDSLSPGTHTIQVISNETSQYVANSTEFTVDVAKKQATISIEIVPKDLVVGTYFNIEIVYDGTEPVVYMDGAVLDEYENIKAIAGTHLIVATINDNEEYVGTTETCNFTVSKIKPSEIYVSGTTVTVGEKTTIEVSDLPKDATGIVIINLNGTKYSMNITESKTLEVVLDNVGSYKLSAQYLGDDKYLPSDESIGNSILSRDKKTNSIDIKYPSEISAGDNVTITVTSDSGAVEVYLDGVNQTLKDNKFTIENIASGTHVIEVASPETSEFKYNSTSEIINVIKKDSEVSIELPQTIVIGEDVEIKVTSTSDGDIAVFVDGVQQKLADGKIIVKATAGNHTVIASVAENDKYKASGANSSFRVDKLDAQIAVSGVDITEGQNTTITIDTELNEGIVVVKINGTEVAVDLAKAKSVDIRLDAAGTYELSASYMGSEIYNPAEALKSTINVDKKETPKVNVTVPEIKANESEPISISIPNATGEVHVIIDGVEEVIPLDKNGNATYTVPKMSAGSHSIVVVYPGDETHDAVIKSMPFEVTKQTSQANITSPSDVKEGENATVKVEIPDATGEVAIIIDGVEHKVALVNGTVEYPLDNLSSGNHSVVVIYPGDEAHDAVYNASSFNVAGKPVIVPIESKFSDITIGENLTISVILKDENGNAIKYAPIIYTINGVANTVNTTSDGSFVIQGENGTMLIVYEGNETFMGTNTTLTLNNTVPPAPVIVRVETKFNFTSVLMIKGYVVDAKAGEKGFEFITVLSDINGNPLANKTVQLAVNSKVYNQVTNESGKVHYYFNMVRAGRYTMTYIFLGDDTCNSTLSSACVDLEKKPITIQASSKTYKVSATKKYTITLKTIVGSSLDGKAHLRAGKKVILTLNGIKYTGKTDANGKVTFNNLKLTKRANYIAKITVEEDNTYLSATKKVTLKVR